MTTTQVEPRMVRIETVDMDGDPYDEMYDANLFNPQLLTLIGKWAEDDDLQARYGQWKQQFWGRSGLRLGDEENDGFFLRSTQGDFEGIVPEVNVCGSAYCMAGQAVVQSGHRLLYYGVSNDWMADDCIKIEPTGEVNNLGRAIYRDVGHRMTIDRAAQDALGISGVESDDLFDGSNCIPFIHQRINGMFEARGMTGPFETDSIQWSHDWYHRDNDGECDAA